MARKFYCVAFFLLSVQILAQKVDDIDDELYLELDKDTDLLNKIKEYSVKNDGSNKVITVSNTDIIDSVADDDPPVDRQEDGEVALPVDDEEDGEVVPAVGSEEEGEVVPPVGSEEDGDVVPPVGSEEDGEVVPPVGSEEDGEVVPPVGSEEEGEVVPPVESEEDGEVVPPVGSEEDGEVVPPVESEEDGEVVPPVDSEEDGEVVPPVESEEDGEVVPPVDSEEDGEVVPPVDSEEDGDVVPPVDSEEDGDVVPPVDSEEDGEVVPPVDSEEDGEVVPPVDSEEDGDVVPPVDSEEDGDVVPPVDSEEDGDLDDDCPEGAVCDDGPVIDIQGATITGIVFTNSDGSSIYAYQSIPYAQPPLGVLRFKDPQPLEGDIVNSPRNDLPFCIQEQIEDLPVTTEDCLYLNVYSPILVDTDADAEPVALKAVMVFIHGGGFVSGNGGQTFYDPQFLLTKDVVVVTMNYRLGVFGFLHFDDPDAGIPGNAGLKDQKMALEWVKENIEHFGGDPENVCLFGQSAGAASVHLHVLSPQSEGLFHKAIIQSGPAISPWVLGVTNNGVALDGALPGTGDAVTRLQAAATEDLLTAAATLAVGLENWQSFASPIVETHEDDDDDDADSTAFLPKDPFEIIESGEYNNVPLLMGYTDAEGIFWDQIMRTTTGSSQLIEDFFDLVQSELDVERDTEDGDELALRIQHFYYGGIRPSLTNMRPYIKIYTDIMFAFPTFRAALEHAKNDDSAAVYFYRFSADTRLNIVKRMDDISTAQPGASHSDDIGYLFYSAGHTPSDINATELEVLDRVLNIWTNFAKTGEPETAETWNPVEEDTANYLDIGTSENVPGVDPDAERMIFWSEVYDEFFRSDASLISGIPILLAVCFVVLQYINQ